MGKKITSLHKIINGHYSELTSKGKVLAEFVLSNPDKAVFMTTRKLAAAVGASEATVVRFVRQLDYASYALFIKALRGLIDTELTLIERSRLSNSVIRSEDAELERITNQDIENIRAMTKNINLAEVKKIRKILKDSEAVYIIGSRLSYTPAYYMGWTLAKIRKNVNIFKGSDRTTIDRLIFASQKSAVVIIATSRYPNELIKMGKLVNRYKLKMILLTDSLSCPLVQFTDHVLIAPLETIPFLGNPTSLISLINYLVHTMAADMGKELKNHQEKLEQAYLENDILFNY
ncbi:MurR/RpiR family transcriptional regulator [Desulfobacula sp.]|uniref:MurR/RpiR family transcriptional regulator n=1 Tax=Desulfobacula sp. TaxID=2593537 RepID=UPI0025BEAE2D|nr:MurR/RpiR family transcriptional regulator [Desulfobacula sp.]MBC2706061.1 MurR/RpiR family transcriptional regulator [Desulfobacula sp.]